MFWTRYRPQVAAAPVPLVADAGQSYPPLATSTAGTSRSADTAAESYSASAAAATAGTGAGATAAATNPAFDARSVPPVNAGAACVVLGTGKVSTTNLRDQAVESQQVVCTVGWHVIVRYCAPSGSQHVDAIRDEFRLDCDVVGRRPNRAAAAARQSRKAEAASVTAASTSRTTRLSAASAG